MYRLAQLTMLRRLHCHRNRFRIEAGPDSNFSARVGNELTIGDRGSNSKRDEKASREAGVGVSTYQEMRKSDVQRYIKVPAIWKGSRPDVDVEVVSNLNLHLEAFAAVRNVY